MNLLIAKNENMFNFFERVVEIKIIDNLDKADIKLYSLSSKD